MYRCFIYFQYLKLIEQNNGANFLGNFDVIPGMWTIKMSLNLLNVVPPEHYIYEVK